MPVMIERQLRRLWEQLQGKKPHLPHFLSEIRLQGIRGIEDLKIKFDYPVSVIAGGNATGKSTALFAAACAYKVPDTGLKDFVPSTLFPDYLPRVGGRRDERREVTIDFQYSTPLGQQSMRWRRSKSWNRSFFGRKGAEQPERPVYLRTLSNLSNPSEVRGVLSMSRLKTPPQETPLTASQIDFAQQALPFRYSDVVDLSDDKNKKALLFAAQKIGAKYSELHMAAGERAILRLSKEIAQREGALVLVDEVEAGLHPWAQQILMLQLQQLALRNDLQIIVTSHSPIVLDSVPRHGRIFLDRDERGQITVLEPYRDLVQDALYGRSRDNLNVLCEDDAAEGILYGVIDFLRPKEEIGMGLLRIGRDTGANQFPQHAAAFKKFGRIPSFIFVLDGDQSDTGIKDKIEEEAGSKATVLFLPGEDAPEVWTWDQLRPNAEQIAANLGITQNHLFKEMERIASVYDSASDSTANIAKSKLNVLANSVNKSSPEICRTVAFLEAQSMESKIQPLVEGLKNALLDWRAERAEFI